MKIKEVMTKEVKCIEVPGSRADALELMKTLKASAIPVVKRGTDELIGMVTFSKLIDHPDEDQLAMLMERDLPTVGPDDDIKVAAKILMDSHVRRLAVVKEGKLIGIITVKDIVRRAIAEMNIETPVTNFMRPHIIAVWSGTPLKAVLQLIRLSGFRIVPVIDENGKLIGTIGDSDIVKLSDIEAGSTMSQMAGRSEGDSWSWDTEARIYITKKELKVPDKIVKDVITSELITVAKRNSVSKTAQLMKQKKSEQVFILADEKLVGTVRDVDLLRALF